MAHRPTTAQSMIIPAEEATAVGLTLSQQQSPSQQHVVQLVKSGQNHLGQNVFLIERPSVVSSSSEKDSTLLKGPTPQIIHLSPPQIGNAPQLISMRQGPVKTYSSAQHPTARKRSIGPVKLQCVQSLPPSLNHEEHSLSSKPLQTAPEPQASNQTANLSPQQQVVQQIKSSQVRAKPAQRIQTSVSHQHQHMSVSRPQQNQQVSPNINHEPLKQSLPRLLQRRKSSPQSTPIVSPKSVTIESQQIVQVPTSQGVSQAHSEMREHQDANVFVKQEQPGRQVLVTQVKPGQQLKQIQVVQQVKNMPQAKVQQLSPLQPKQSAQQMQLVKQVNQGQHRQLLKQVAQTKQGQPLSSLKAVHPAHKLKQLQTVQQLKEVLLSQQVKSVQPVKQVQEEENCNRLSKLILENSETVEVRSNLHLQTEVQEAPPPSIVVSCTSATINHASVQTIDSSPGNRKLQVASNNLVFERTQRVVPAIVGKGSKVPMASPIQHSQIQAQPKAITSQSLNISNQSSVVPVPSNQVQVSHPQVTYLSIKSGQSIGHQPGNSHIRLIQTAPLAKQISQIQQQHQLVQLSLPQLAVSQQQHLIQLPPGHQIVQSQSAALYQLQQSSPGQQPQIIQVQAHSLPIQQQVQLQLQSAEFQSQLQAQQQAQLQAQQQAQLQAQQQAQLQAQQQAQLQAQQQAQLQAQQQAQLQAQQQVQLQAQQQAQIQAQQALLQVQQQAQLQQAQQQAHLQVQQQLRTQQQPQVQLQGQLQVHPEAQMNSQQSIILQVPQQPQVHSQQEEQQLDQQQALLVENQQESQEEHVLVEDGQLLMQQGSALFIQQPQQSESDTATVSESEPQNNQTLTLNATNSVTVQAPEVTQTKQRDMSDEEKIQEILRKVQLPSPAKGYENRIIATRNENGQITLIIQQVPDVSQGANISQLQEVEQLIAPVEEEAVTVYDGVSVESEFLTGVPQECVVSESGELVFAEVNSGTNIVADKAIQPHAELVTSKFSPSTLTTGVQEPAQMEEEKPEVIPGLLALCKHCGVCSTNLNKCVRCNSVFPKDVKYIKEDKLHLTQTPKTVVSAASLAAPLQTTTSMLRRELTLPFAKLGVKPIARALQPLLIGTPVTEVKRKRCSTPRASKPKVPEEPEILTLSSDDEDKLEKPPKKLDAESQLLASSCASELETEEESGNKAAAEESDLEETRRQSAGVAGGGMLQQVIDGSIPSPFVVVSCRTVRVGTYKEKPLEKVVISTQGLELKLALPSGSVTTVNIPMQDITRVLVSFCRSMPIVFLYLKSTAGHKVRESMQMTDPKSSHYYEPESSDEMRKRIILIPDKINEEIKMNIKRIFENRKKVFAEIDNTLANQILVKSTQNHDTSRTRTGASATEIQTLMVYPPPPSKGGISINTEDYACLGEDQFLNDVIIDFYLKYLMQSVWSEEDRERTHVFSSFFYKRLTSKPKIKGRRHPIEDDPKLSPAEKRHARVKTWTKNVNLFTKDFIIIPINESCHWFLAIICFPGQDGCVRMSDNTPVTLPKPPPKPSPTAAVAAAAAAAAATTHSKLKVRDNVISIGSTTITPVKAPATSTIMLDNHGDDGSDRDEAEGDEEEMAENASDDEDSGQVDENNGFKYSTENATTGSDSAIDNTSATSSLNLNEVLKEKKPIIREGIKQPCILIFDSLVGAPRYRVAATLREYLTIEYKVKEGKEKPFNKDTIKGMLPKVPQQTNFTDCGLYLLQYVEMFFKDPIRDYHAPIKQLVNWFSEEIVSCKREEISNLLKDLMKEQNVDPEKLSLLSRISSASATQSKAVQMTEDQEALARLDEADRQAQKEIALRQLARLQKSDEPSNVLEHVGQVATYESEIELPNNAESTNLPESGQDSAVEDKGTLGTTLSCQRESCIKKVSLVEYDTSSADSDIGLSKRSPNPIDAEDIIEKKKMKAE